MFIEHEFYIEIVENAFLDQCWAILKCIQFSTQFLAQFS
jgi:hypothetical protein